jgi:hypothetical protein
MTDHHPATCYLQTFIDIALELSTWKTKKLLLIQHKRFSAAKEPFIPLRFIVA